MKDDTKRPDQPHLRPQESITLLKKELRKRGMSPADIEQTLKKKRRRKQLEFDIVISRRAIPPEKRSPAPKKPRGREPQTPVSRDVCTVDVAADLLGLHPKTVLRFIRAGQLPARRVGKSWRILRGDLETFGGIPAPKSDLGARMTSIIDLPDVGPDLARKWAAAISGAVKARGGSVTADVVHEADRRHLKIVIVGAADDTAAFMSLVRDWLARLR